MSSAYKYGIDFGTSNCSIAIVMPKTDGSKGYEPVCFDLNGANQSLFSKVMASDLALSATGQIVEVGNRAIQAKVNGLAKHYITDIKWHLTDEVLKDNAVELVFNGKPFSGLDAATALFRALKHDADEVKLSKPVNGIVIGVPVDFEISNRYILLEAAINAGFVENSEDGRASIEFLSEPLAVAEAKGIDFTKDQRVMIFDHGGKTLDIAIMDIKGVSTDTEVRELEVLCKDVEISAGGKQLTWKLFSKGFLAKYGSDKLIADLGMKSPVGEVVSFQKELYSIPEGLELYNKLEEIKVELTTNETATLTLTSGKLSIPQMTFDQDLFKSCIDDELNLVKLSIDRALSLAKQNEGITKEDIDLVIMAGGSSNVRAVRNTVEEFFGSDKVVLGDDPLMATAEGLAVHGFGNSGLLTGDVTENEYGVFDHDTGQISVIVPKGTPLSATKYNPQNAKNIGKHKQYVLIDADSKHLEADISINQTIKNTIKVNKIDSNETYLIFLEVDEKNAFYQVKPVVVHQSEMAVLTHLVEDGNISGSN
jgi:molecular chaperone DnaK (HSP70)